MELQQYIISRLRDIWEDDIKMVGRRVKVIQYLLRILLYTSIAPCEQK